jgi:hypothetical protein
MPAVPGKRLTPCRAEGPMGRAPRPDCAGLVIGYAALTVASIEKGVELLAELLRSQRHG